MYYITYTEAMRHKHADDKKETGLPVVQCLDQSDNKRVRTVQAEKMKQFIIFACLQPWSAAVCVKTPRYHRSTSTLKYLMLAKRTADTESPPLLCQKQIMLCSLQWRCLLPIHPTGYSGQLLFWLVAINIHLHKANIFGKHIKDVKNGKNVHLEQIKNEFAINRELTMWLIAIKLC